MKYAREVIELMAAYPGRDFKMAELVRAASPTIPDARTRGAVRQGVLRVVTALIENGSVLRRPTRPGVRTQALYRWRNATRAR